MSACVFSKSSVGTGLHAPICLTRSTSSSSAFASSDPSAGMYPQTLFTNLMRCSFSKIKMSSGDMSVMGEE
jgi:hypothetical protein